MEKLIFPLYLLPPLDYIQAMIAKPKAYISTGELFQKQTFRNRFEIMSPNKRHMLSVPVQKGKTKLRMKEVKISYAEPWPRKHWQALETAYENSPFFEYYDYKLKPIFTADYEFLWEYNYALLKEVLRYLKVDIELELTDELPNTEALIVKQTTPEYDQVFMEKHGFMNNLSVLDWVFNVGSI
jgi:hypothetical protein